MNLNQQNYRKAKLAEIIERRSKVADLYLNRRLTMPQIAGEIGVSIFTVSEDFHALLSQWQKQAAQDISAHCARELQKLEALEATALDGYRLSKNLKKVASASKREFGSGQEATMVTTASATQHERTEGDPRFLQVVMHCIELRIKLLGLDRKLDEIEDKRPFPKTLTEFVAMQYKEKEDAERDRKAKMLNRTRPAAGSVISKPLPLP